MNNASQDCQDESGVLKVLNAEEKKKFNSTEDLYNREKEGNIFKGNNIRNKDVIIEIYLICKEERLLDTKISSKRFNNFTKEEQEALYSLKDDPSITIKGADKGSVVVVWDREDDLKEAYRQLDDKKVYEQVPDNPSALANILTEALEKIHLWGDLSKDTLDYFLVKDPKFARFYLLPKIHKRLHDVPGRPVISNCGYYTGNISSFLGYHLQPLIVH